MTQIGYKCPQGWDPKDLLSYVEGGLNRVARGEIDRHLDACAVCASEVKLLQRAHDLLTRHPEVFHPDEEELYHLVSGDMAPDAAAHAHVQSCPQCQEEVAMLRDIMSSGGEIPKHSAEMPKTLVRRVERLYGARRVFWSMSRLRALLSDLIGLPFRAPALALSTAAALLVVAILAIPMWQTFKRGHQPQEMAPATQSRSVGGQGSPLEATKDRKVSDLSVSDQAVPSGKRVGGRATPHQSEPATKGGPAPSLSLKHGAAEYERESWPAGTPRYARPTHPGYGDGLTHPGLQTSRQRYQEAGRPDSKRKMREESVTQRRIAAPSARVKPDREREELRVPVEIKIQDTGGNPVPWVRFEAPDRLEDRYSFFEGGPKEKDLLAPRSELTPQEGRTSAERSGAARLITVSIGRRGDMYDLTATLSEISSGQVRKTDHAVAISRQDVAEKVKALVVSLLSE